MLACCSNSSEYFVLKDFPTPHLDNWYSRDIWWLRFVARMPLAHVLMLNRATVR